MVPAALHDAAKQCLVGEHPLSDFIHAAIITAVKAARRGDAHLLPRSLPDRLVQKYAAGKAGAVQVRYTASRREATDNAATLEAVGSSERLVVVVALWALVEAEGIWADALTPGEPGWHLAFAGAA